MLVGKLNKPVLKALDYAIAARHETIEAIHVSIDDAATEELERQWVQHNIKIPLRILDSPYRDISVPLIKYIKACRVTNGSEIVTVYTPQFIVGHWWENLLHNHKARRIRHKLMLTHGVMVALVPWLLDSSDMIYGRRSRPLPGQDRRGEPRRPVQRRAMPPADLKAARQAARDARNGVTMRSSDPIPRKPTAAQAKAGAKATAKATAAAVKREKVGAAAAAKDAASTKPGDAE